jgi:hypothetical protein
MDRSKGLTFFRKSGAGEGIRTLNPNLGKVLIYLANHLCCIAEVHRAKTLGFQMGVPPQHFPVLMAGYKGNVFNRKASFE